MSRWLLAVLLLAGCRFVEAPEEVPCIDDAYCPSGYWCPMAGEAEALCTAGSRPTALDADGDGFEPPEDCDDTDPAIHPDAVEDCVDGAGVDSNCDGVDERDDDGDGVSECQGDCDDDDPFIHPDATELCDDVDSNCDGQDDLLDPALDADGDGFSQCQSVDCDDDDPLIHPGAEEVCDGNDNDCDGVFHPDELDADGDQVRVCEGDCDDSDPSVHPLADEICDGKDNDCDQELGTLETTDADGDLAALCDDCDDTNADVFPGAGELCDGLDNDCDGVVPPEEANDDGDPVLNCNDCAPTEPAIYPGAPELCDGLDNDCSGDPDADEVDDDTDGSLACEDCDDADPAAFPGNPETCDGIDNDCDGVVPPEEADGDSDLESPCEGDCDDTDDTVHSAADELCSDLVDNNCDGDIDECNEWVVFSSDQLTSIDLDLWVTDLGQTVEWRLTDLLGDETDAAISPDGTHVAFLHDDFDSQELMLAGLDSFSVSTLTAGDCPGGISPPSWHPDGDRVVIGCSVEDGSVDFVEVTTQGALTTLFDPTDEALTPTWSPDGLTLAEVVVLPTDEEVVRLRDAASGLTTDLTRTQNLLPKGQPVWSPDGAWLAYAELDGDTQAILLADVAQTEAAPLTLPGPGFEDGDPAWYPDGTQLFFGRKSASATWLMTVDVDSGAESDWLLSSPAVYQSAASVLLPPGEAPGQGDVDGDGLTWVDGDCDDADADTFPAATELCDGADNDCDGILPSDESDDDGDGSFPCGGDCDDLDATVYPWAPELCDGLDNVCAGSLPEDELDDDADGFIACAECDDADPAVHPNAEEDCTDAIDNDCDGVAGVCTEWVIHASDRAAPGEYDLWATDVGQSGFIQITDLPGDQLLPVVNPAGSHVAFVDHSSGSSQVAVVELHSLEITYDSADATPCSGEVGSPDWHPTLNQLLVTCLNGGSNTFVAIDVDSGSVASVWAHGQDLAGAAWSPDGADLVYGGTDYFGVYDIGGGTDGRFHSLTDASTDVEPAWSATDDWIVWTRHEAVNQYNLYRIDADETDQLKLTSHPVGERAQNGRFSPDGLYVLYSHRDAAVHHSLRVIEALGYNDAVWLDEVGINNRDGHWAVLSPSSIPGSLDADGDGVTVVDDCDDNDPLSFPGGTDTDADGIDQDCDGYDGAASEGDIQVVEFLYNPEGDDSCGEYFEVLNTTAAPVSLLGWNLGDGADCASFGEQTVLGNVLVPAGDRVLLAAENADGDCDGIDGLVNAVRYPRAHMFLGLDDSLMLCRGETVIDRLEWDPSWPLPLNSGTALNFDQNLDLSNVDNDDPADWCFASSSSTLPLVNLGTPGTINDGC